ncbi:hypothetical protein ABT160_31115 [Streptomyces sp. NPDC001941]|uniref:hypothetical protein n=1 Tax=Streptomyces sp. NPDC001941 TaxID=3154659 RepID=UPI0033178BAA
MNGLDIAAPDTEATGPADRWWLADGIAIHLQLDTWWNARDTWHVRCFARHATDLPTLTSVTQRSIAGVAVLEEDWCALCSQFRHHGAPCIPVPSSGHGASR